MDAESNVDGLCGNLFDGTRFAILFSFSLSVAIGSGSTVFIASSFVDPDGLLITRLGIGIGGREIGRCGSLRFFSSVRRPGEGFRGTPLSGAFSTLPAKETFCSAGLPNKGRYA